MSEATSNSQLMQAVLDLTEKMRVTVEAEGWEELYTIEQERLSLIKQIFAGGPIDSGEEFIRNIMAFDEEMLHKVKAAKDKIYDETKSLLNNRRAVDAYANSMK